MFIGQLLKGNPNFIVIEVFKTISRVQVFFQNKTFKDYTGNSLHLKNIHVIHVYGPVFQGEFELDLRKNV